MELFRILYLVGSLIEGRLELLLLLRLLLGHKLPLLLLLLRRRLLKLRGRPHGLAKQRGRRFEASEWSVKMCHHR